MFPTLVICVTLLGDFGAPTNNQTINLKLACQLSLLVRVTCVGLSTFRQSRDNGRIRKAATKQQT
jgi:hypothetical protein